MLVSYVTAALGAPAGTREPADRTGADDHLREATSAKARSISFASSSPASSKVIGFFGG
jgi:hypothetical protein